MVPSHRSLSVLDDKLDRSLNLMGIDEEEWMGDTASSEMLTAATENVPSEVYGLQRMTAPSRPPDQDYLVSVIKRTLSMDHSCVSDTPQSSNRKEALVSENGKTLVGAIKRIRADEKFRADEMYRMVQIAMSRTDEMSNAPTYSKVEQEQQLRVVVTSKLNKNSRNCLNSANDSEGRVVAATGSSVVIASATSSSTHPEKSVARARCA